MINIDIVILLNVTGSMNKSFPLLKTSLINFVKKLEEKFEDTVRYKICGFRDQESDGDKWFIDFPFVRNIEEVKYNLNHADMDPRGGCGSPDSLLDALYKIGSMPRVLREFDFKAPEDPNKWCALRKLSRIVVIFSDYIFKNATLPEISGFGIVDIYNKIEDRKLVLLGLVPEWIGFDDLGACPRSQFNYYTKGPAIANLGIPGPEGEAAILAAQQSLEKFLKESDENLDWLTSSVLHLKEIENDLSY